MTKRHCIDASCLNEQFVSLAHDVGICHASDQVPWYLASACAAGFGTELPDGIRTIRPQRFVPHNSPLIIFTKSFYGALEFLALVNITFHIWKMI
uniref:Uncharacterized protein n=1 Tax=Romanomermis culicivorax TaxID=13658 RepID=A0A915KJN0_ROMCU